MNRSNQDSTNEVAPVVLVTGAGQRVGNHVARSLAADGYRVALHANSSLADAQRTADELLSAGAGSAIALQADLRDEDAVDGLVRAVHDQFGRIDGLVNCASVWTAKRLEETSAADVRQHFDVNTLATFLCCRQVGLVMVGQTSGGSIVNIGDWAVVRPYLNYAAYFVSKGAIETLTRDLAVELASRNPEVRVNAILPGPVLLPTEMSATERALVVSQTLVKREGSPQHVADAVRFLFHNDFVTGVCLPVDGGRSIYAG